MLVLGKGESPTSEANPRKGLVSIAHDSIRMEEIEILALTGLFIWILFDQIGPVYRRIPLSHESVTRLI